MTEPSHKTEQATAELQVPMPRVIRFVRQLSHDLRNHLNAAELQAAYMNEIATDAEGKDEVQRLRGMFSEMGNSLQKLNSTLADTNLTSIPYEGAAFFEDLRAKLSAQFPKEKDAVQWNGSSPSGTLNIDPQILQQAFLELFANAFQHGRGGQPIQAGAEQADGDLVFTLREPKTQFDASPANWGREPFAKVKHGHYGLGLHRARSIIEAHGGRYHAHYDSASASLVTRVALPIASA